MVCVFFCVSFKGVVWGFVGFWGLFDWYGLGWR